MNVVDSSAWLEFFAGGPNADHFVPAIKDVGRLVVPTLVLYEVFKRFLQQKTEGEALQAVAAIQQGTVIDLSASLSLSAAKISIDQKLPMADSIILATARAFNAVVWTQDQDFEGLDGVRYFPKPEQAT